MEKLRNVVLDIFVTLSIVDAANIFTGLKTVSFIVVFLLFHLSLVGFMVVIMILVCICSILFLFLCY